MGCLKSLSFESILWRLLYQNMVLEALRPLRYWSISPFIICGSKEASGVLGSCDYLRGWEAMNSRKKGSEIWKDRWQTLATAYFANLVLAMPLAQSVKPEDWGWLQNQLNNTDLSKHLSRKRGSSTTVQSERRPLVREEAPWSERRCPGRDNLFWKGFSNRRGSSLSQGKTPVQCENTDHG